VTGDPILVAGEALFDLVPDEAGSLEARPGGAPFNVVRTIARLGVPAAYLGRLSRDRLGAQLEQMLVEDGVGVDAVVATDDPTTLAMVEVDAAGSAAYRFYDQGTSAPGLTPEAALAAVPRDVSMLHVGSLGLALEPIGSAVEAIVERLAGGALVMVDPNCRPAAVRDVDAYRERLRRVVAWSDVVKVSDDDLSWLDPGRLPRDAARALLEAGPAVVLLTLGAAGAVALTPDDEQTVPAQPANVVDTIGAGDAFGGGFLAWWHARGLARGDLSHGAALAGATAFACEVAARTCVRAGAAPPTVAELGKERWER
jgi:fructokinase